MSILEIQPTDIIGTCVLTLMGEQGQEMIPCYTELLGGLVVGDRVRVKVHHGWVKTIRRV